jgi:exocyst complex component 1
MVGADTLEIRGNVDGAYEQIVQVMFESLQQMAKMDGVDGQATEDKEHLNYHVILIGQLFILFKCVGLN